MSTVYLLVMIFVTGHELNNSVFMNTFKQSFSSKAACLQVKNTIESDVSNYGFNVVSSHCYTIEGNNVGQ